MKRFLFFLIAGWFLLSAQVVQAARTKPGLPEPVAQSTEEIIRFDSKITINQDTSLSITESIDYFTPEEKHGIYRYIPERYRREGKVVSNKVTQISVTSEVGEGIPFQVSRENGNVTMKIGDENKTFSGRKTFVISYKVAKAILQHPEFDELYWDITGEGWAFPIKQARVFITSPFAQTTEKKCFTGPIGGTESECLFGFSSTETIAFTNKQINYGDNFTVALKLDKANSLIFPSKMESLLEIILNNWTLALLPLPGIAMFLYWYKKGRDFRFVSQNVFDSDPNLPQGLRPLFEPINIPMVYEPLKDLTPGEAGTLLDERVDNQDVVAEIIDLARKKFLKIERVENKGFLRFGCDYLFTKLKESQNLPEHQAYLLKNIFDSKTEVKMSELKGTFYIHMAKVKEMLYGGLTKKKMFTSKPMNALGIGMVIAIILNIGVFVATISTISFLQSGWAVLVLFVSFTLSLVFAMKMPQKTAVGTNFSLQAKGLRETIRLGKWREEIKEKHLFIEEVLPFAISLGVIGKLANDMAKLNLTPPKYMSGGLDGNTLAWSGFMSDFSKTASSGLSYNPSSSSAGGSGFSGGSSGGGGGGGGGGSW